MLRPEPAVQYKRLVKRTMIGALRSVFSFEYPDKQFAELYVSTTNPIKREQFPCIIVKFNEKSIQNSGVSHEEVLSNDNGLHQSVRHFYFEGAISFTISALSPLDLDILCDSLIELLAFGRLNSLMSKFFSRIYDEIEDGYQFTIASDKISGGQESTAMTQWNSEDLLVYQSSYLVNCHGAFYSLLDKGQIHDYVDKIIAYGSETYDKEEQKLFEIVGKVSPQYYYIKGEGIVSSVEDYAPFQT